VFSARIPADLHPNRLTALLHSMRRQGQRVIDLTQSNPTQAGIVYPADLLSALGQPRGLIYAPEPNGLRIAREAIASDYARRGVRLEPDDLVLTASTSDAYSLLFKTLCDPGDEVLVPHPSYPLFEHLTRLDSVTAVPYALDYHGSWAVDIGSIERALTDRARALLAVSPNNPTGSYLKAHELAAIEAICARHGLALIVDEVFGDYPLTTAPMTIAARPLESANCLVFALGGLSKSVGLPQTKLAWIALAGPPALVREAGARLEFAADAYLSASTPVQLAAADLLERGAPVRRAIHDRVVKNLQTLADLTAAAPACQLLSAEAGWYGVLQVPSLSTEEELVIDILTTSGVLVHPGYFFDFPRESFLVASLLPPEPEFVEGATAILRHFDCRAG
jgi:alanine-synthesizing transaminase